MASPGRKSIIGLLQGRSPYLQKGRSPPLPPGRGRHKVSAGWNMAKGRWGKGAQNCRGTKGRDARNYREQDKRDFPGACQATPLII